MCRLTNGQPGKESQDDWLHRYKYWDRTHAKKKKHDMQCISCLILAMRAHDGEVTILQPQSHIAQV